MADKNCPYYKLSFDTRGGNNPDFDYMGWPECIIFNDRCDQINHQTCYRFLRKKGS